MAMSIRIEPVLHPVALQELRPTQMTVGMREVARKRSEWRERNERDGEGGEFLGRHMLPAVIGPRGTTWLIDHHHLARALHEEGVTHVLVSVLARLEHLRKRHFFSFMDSQNWLHPYDSSGELRGWKDLPRHVGKLVDDPYRSLAGAVRRAGGFAKSSLPYAEFLWADYFRDRIAARDLAHRFDKALARAIAHARAKAASYLPGFAGAED